LTALDEQLATRAILVTPVTSESVAMGDLVSHEMSYDNLHNIDVSLPRSTFSPTASTRKMTAQTPLYNSDLNISLRR
jgi:hypothetical protein